MYFIVYYVLVSLFPLIAVTIDGACYKTINSTEFYNLLWFCDDDKSSSIKLAMVTSLIYSDLHISYTRSCISCYYFQDATIYLYTCVFL